MKAVIQRVSLASVAVEGKTVGNCNKGYMILFGAENGDTEAEAITKTFWTRKKKRSLFIRSLWMLLTSGG